METYSIKERICPTKAAIARRTFVDVGAVLEDIESGGYFVFVAFADGDLIAQ